jgi:hypothetical protein
MQSIETGERVLLEQWGYDNTIEIKEKQPQGLTCRPVFARMPPARTGLGSLLWMSGGGDMSFEAPIYRCLFIAQ